MVRKGASTTDGKAGLAATAYKEFGRLAIGKTSALYAVLAKLSIGRVEDLADLKAARRSRLDLAAAKRQGSLAKTSKSGS